MKGKYGVMLAPKHGLPKLGPEEGKRVAEILERFGIPPEEREEWLCSVVAFIEVALDAYLDEVRQRRKAG